jgi:hypothetical protein
VREQLDVATFATGRFARAFGVHPKLAPIGREQREQPIRLAVIGAL